MPNDPPIVFVALCAWVGCHDREKATRDPSPPASTSVASIAPNPSAPAHPTLHVVVDGAAAARLGVSADEVRAALEAAHVVVAGGRTDENETDFAIANPAPSPETVGAILIAPTAIPLSAVATIEERAQ